MGKLGAQSAKWYSNTHRSFAGAVLFLMTRCPDIFAVPWLLSMVELQVYLIARVASLCIPFALAGVGARAEPMLRTLLRDGSVPAFQAATARINLGYLMISGALSVLMIGCVPYLSNFSGLHDALLREVLIWLVVGQSAPVLFGATGLLMKVVERGTFYHLLSGLTATLFLASVLISKADTGMVVAQSLAAAQLTLSALCALLLTQSGIWPGLTALFHRQIKLF